MNIVFFIFYVFRVVNDMSGTALPEEHQKIAEAAVDSTTVRNAKRAFSSSNAVTVTINAEEFYNIVDERQNKKTKLQEINARIQGLISVRELYRDDPALLSKIDASLRICTMELLEDDTSPLTKIAGTLTVNNTQNSNAELSPVEQVKMSENNIYLYLTFSD